MRCMSICLLCLAELGCLCEGLTLSAQVKAKEEALGEHRNDLQPVPARSHLVVSVSLSEKPTMGGKGSLEVEALSFEIPDSLRNEVEITTITTLLQRSLCQAAPSWALPALRRPGR